MRTINFFAAGHPKGQPRPKAFARKFGEKWQARVYDPGTAENWKSQIASALRNAYATWEPFTGPVELRVVFYMPRPKSHYRSNGALKPNAPEFCETKPDLDNLEKAVMDCFTTLTVWLDDAQVCRKFTAKVYVDKLQDRTGALLTVTEVANG